MGMWAADDADWERGRDREKNGSDKELLGLGATPN